MSVAAYLERALRLAAAAGPGVPLQRILDRAMAGDDGALVLAPGEAAEARRLLGLVRWKDVPRQDRPYWLARIARIAWHPPAISSDARVCEDRLQEELRRCDLLAEPPKGRAA